MQVIAGKYGGRKLTSIDSKSTRPTLARVKESMFAMIDPFIEGSKVLDLFAGSGALGLEAISRGASEVTFVESNKEAVKIIEKNLARVTETHDIYNMDYIEALKRFESMGKKFDLVLLDPPYASDFAEKLLRKFHLLNKNAIIVYEQESKKCLQNDDNEYIIEKTRAYGTAKVVIFKYIGE